MFESISSSDADYVLAQRAVERGWLKKEQLEAALVARDRVPGSRLFAHLPLSPDQLRELDSAHGATILASAAITAARDTLPPEVAEALRDPKRRVGRFAIINLLGKGGMGMVFRGWEPELRQWVALKFLKHIGDDTARAYFKREAQLAAGLDHPNIAKIYEVGEHDGQPFIAMQFVDGESLATAKKEMKLEAKINAVKKIAEAVRYAHDKKVIHRDLKPANVMIDRHGQVYMMDFGLAKMTAVEGESIGGSSLVVGTPSYMAPEQAKGKADPQSDVYGIGAILYELVTGRPPFTGETATDVMMQVVEKEPVWPRKLSPDTPAELEAIILHALEKDKRRRYADARQLIEDFDAFMQNNPLRHARRPTFTYVVGKKIRKQPVLWGAVTAMILAIVGGAAYGSYFLVQRNQALKDKVTAEKDKLSAEQQKLAAQNDKLSAVEEGRRKVEEQHRQVLRSLANTYLVRARQSADAGDISRALLLYAEANATSPSYAAQANAQYFLRRVRPLREMRQMGGPAGHLRFDDQGHLHAIAKPEYTLEEDEMSVGFSPDGEYFCTGLARKGMRTVLRIRRTTDGSIIGDAEPALEVPWISFSPDGSMILGKTEKGVLRVWETRDPRKSRVVFNPDENAQAYVSGSCFGVDGRSVYAWINGAMYKIDIGADVISWPRAINQSTKAGYGIHRCAFGPDGQFMFITSGRDLGFIAPTSLKVYTRENAHEEHIMDWTYTPDGKTLVTASRDGTIKFWNYPSLEPAGETLQVSGGLWSVALSNDGARIAAGTASGRLWIWEKSPPLSVKLPGVPPARQAEWLSHGTTIAFSAHFLSQPGYAFLYDVTAGRTEGDMILIDGFPYASEMADGKRVLFHGERETVVVEAKDGRVVNRLSGRSGPVSARPFGAKLLVDEKDGHRLWDPDANTFADLPPGLYEVFAHGTRVLEAIEKQLRVRDAADHVMAEAMLDEEPISVDVVWDAEDLITCLLKGGRFLRLGAKDLKLRGAEIKLPPTVKWAHYVASHKLIIGGEKFLETTVALVDDGARTLKLPEGEQGLFGAQIAPGYLRAVIKKGKERRLWNCETGQIYGEAIPASLEAFTYFTWDGTGFVMTTRGTIQLFDMATGKPRWPETKLPRQAQSISFEADGRAMLVLCQGHGVFVYDAATGHPIGLPLITEGQGDRSVLNRRPGGTEALLFHFAESPGNQSVDLWDLGFLSALESPEELRRQARLTTKLWLNDAQEVKPMPDEDWLRLSKEATLPSLPGSKLIAELSRRAEEKTRTAERMKKEAAAGTAEFSRKVKKGREDGSLMIRAKNLLEECKGLIEKYGATASGVELRNLREYLQRIVATEAAGDWQQDYNRVKDSIQSLVEKGRFAAAVRQWKSFGETSSDAVLHARVDGEIQIINRVSKQSAEKLVQDTATLSAAETRDKLEGALPDYAGTEGAEIIRAKLKGLK